MSVVCTYSSILNKIHCIFVINFLNNNKRTLIFTHTVPNPSPLYSLYRSIFTVSIIFLFLRSCLFPGFFPEDSSCLGLLTASVPSFRESVKLYLGCPSLHYSLETLQSQEVGQSQDSPLSCL